MMVNHHIKCLSSHLARENLTKKKKQTHKNFKCPKQLVLACQRQSDLSALTDKTRPDTDNH